MSSDMARSRRISTFTRGALICRSVDTDVNSDRDCNFVFSRGAHRYSSSALGPSNAAEYCERPSFCPRLTKSPWRRYTFKPGMSLNRFCRSAMIVFTFGLCLSWRRLIQNQPEFWDSTPDRLLSIHGTVARILFTSWP